MVRALLIAMFVAVASPALAEEPVPMPGDPAPALALEALLQAPDGADVSPEGLADHVVVIEFFNQGCRGCFEAMPHLNALAEQLADRPVRFLSITNDAPEVVDEILANHQVPGWVGVDTDESAFDDYVVLGVPTTVLIDRQGRLVAFTRPEMVTAAVIESLLDGREVEIPWESSLLRFGGRDASAPPQAAVMVRATERDEPMAVSVGRSWRGVGMNLDRMLGWALNLAPAQYEIELGVDDRQAYDLMVRAPADADDLGAALDALKRKAIEDTWQVELTTITAERDVLELTLADDATCVAPAGTEWSEADASEAWAVIPERSMGDIVRLLERALRQPVVLGEGLDPEATRAWRLPNPERDALTDCGLLFTEQQRLVEVLAVRPRGEVTE